MRRTRPWVLFLSILGFLGAGLMFIVGIFMFFAGAMASAVASSAGPMGGLGPFIGLIYLALAAFYVVPSVLLWRYGMAIGQYTNSGGDADSLAEAVKRQS